MPIAKIRSAALTLLLLSALFLLACRSAAFAEAVQLRLDLCLYTLIPSLFGCMALAELLLASGAAGWLGCRLLPLARALHLSPELLAVFLLSQVAGYPVGAMLLSRICAAGRLSNAEAARLCCACYGGGPAFLIGMAGVQLFGSLPAGLLLMGACIFANACILMLMRPKIQPNIQPNDVQLTLNAETLTGAVSRAMRSLAGICGMVLLFGIVMQLCELTGLSALAVRLGGAAGISAQQVRAWLAAALDITQLHGLFVCGLPFRSLLTLCAAMLSFGGLCAQLQCKALGGAAVRGGRLLLMRLLAAMLAAWLTHLLAGYIPMAESAAVFAAQPALSRTGSALPALLIFFTGFPILIKKD